MLKKLFKYDVKAVGRFWWIAAVTMLALIVLSGVAMSSYIFNFITMASGVDFDIVNFLVIMISYFAMLICMIGVGACFIAVEILIFIRYFKHLFTDEGYLTFTLPVSRKDIFLSKVISGAFWNCMTFLVAAIGYVIATAIVFVPYLADEGIRPYFIELVRVIVNGIEIPATQYLWFALWGIIAVIGVIASAVMSVCMTYFCITFGATVAKKGKIAAAIGIYYGMASIGAFVFETLISLGTVFMSAGAIEILLRTSALDINVIITLVLVLVAAIISTLAAFFYSITCNILERKLNLA